MKLVYHNRETNVLLFPVEKSQPELREEEGLGVGGFLVECVIAERQQRMNIREGLRKLLRRRNFSIVRSDEHENNILD